MNNKKRIVVAMSGGVDSSVAAALLAREGHEVIGITLRLWTPSPWNQGERVGGCCSPEDIAHAKTVCRGLGVPHYTYNLEEKFKETVVDNFVSEYLEGRTPNPCVRCNAFIKFDVLLKYSVALNADALATGHYARISDGVRGSGFGVRERQLKKAKDLNKDQSYFLYMLNQDQLSKILFPLGQLTKPQVRRIAEEFKLVNAAKADSQDVCFLEGRNYREFLNERVEPAQIKKGLIKTKEGKVLGTHEGLPFYTIGQREKLGISAGHRMYVVQKDLDSNTLLVGTEQENLTGSCVVQSVSWCSGKVPEKIRAQVKIRYRHLGVPSVITALPQDQALVQFETPQPSVAAGQSAVFYDGETVLGGGVISHAAGS